MVATRWRSAYPLWLELISNHYQQLLYLQFVQIGKVFVWKKPFFTAGQEDNKGICNTIYNIMQWWDTDFNISMFRITIKSLGMGSGELTIIFWFQIHRWSVVSCYNHWSVLQPILKENNAKACRQYYGQYVDRQTITNFTCSWLTKSR